MVEPAINPQEEQNISSEVYDTLLQLMIPRLSSTGQVEVEFDNLFRVEQNFIPRLKEPKEEILHTAVCVLNQSKNPKKPVLMYSDIAEMKKFSLASFHDQFETLKNFNVVRIWVKQVDVSLELMASRDYTLSRIKELAIEQFGSQTQVNLDESICNKFRFSYKDVIIPKVDDELSLFLALSKNNMEDAVEENILSLDMELEDRKSEIELIKQIFLQNKEQNEVMRTLIKFEKSNKKMKQRILILRREDNNLYTIIITKPKDDSMASFPMTSIKSIDSEASASTSEDKLTKLVFLDELKWPDLKLNFIFPDQYLVFLESFIANKRTCDELQKKHNFTEERARKATINTKNALTPFIDSNSRKITTNLSTDEKTTTNDNSNVQKGVGFSHAIEDILKQTKDISLIIESADEKRQQQEFMEIEQRKNEVMTKEYLELFERQFTVKQSNMLKLKSQRMCKFTTGFELEFYKINSTKFLCSYHINDIQNVEPILNSQGKKFKIHVNFKGKKMNYISMQFKTKEEMQRFIETYNSIIDYMDKNNKRKKLFNKDVKRYSWLLQSSQQPSKVQKKVLESKGESELIFNVIVSSKGSAKQIAHINLLSGYLTFLSPTESVLKQIEIKKIVILENHYYDTRKLSIKSDKKKTIELIFQDIKSKLIFESAINTIKGTNIHSELVLEPKKDKFFVYTTTWNVGFSEPPPNLISLFKDLKIYDLVVIGLQEIKAQTWMEKLQSFMNYYKYSLITCVTMWRMMIVAFVKRPHAHKVKNLEVVSKPTGIANLIGNKGGMMISFNIAETSFCFISSHLAAKPHRVELRKANYYDLIKHLRTGTLEIEPVFQFDYCFWFGDFNFRVDHPFEKVVELVKEGRLEEIKEHDQLTKERNNNFIFSDFFEGDIKFIPTYRRSRTDDTWSNKKNQSPSWCDRVLFRAKPNLNIEPLEYSSREQQMGSDHRPVFATFLVEIEPPYIANPPIHFRKKYPDGLLRITDISLEYELSALVAMEEFITVQVPFEISISFYAPFLTKNPSTFSVRINEPRDNLSVRWDQNSIPIIYTAHSDLNFLRQHHIFLLLTASPVIKEGGAKDVLIGQTCISLKDLMDNNGQNIQFDANVCLFGKIFGIMEGAMEYDIEPSEEK